MKNLLKILLIAIVPILFIVGCDNPEREKAGAEKIKGATQQTVGHLTNDPAKKTEGTVNKTKGDLRSTKEDVKDYIKGN